jgi:dihydrofolate synthase/folylpolyglutamate synthase
MSLSIPLLGMHQVENVLTALETARLFLARHDMHLAMDETAAALSRVYWPGRMEQISKAPDIWIDVGHTPDALRRVIDAFLTLYKREEIIVVYGISYNKDKHHITQFIESHFDQIVLTQAYKNGTAVETLKEMFEDKRKIIAAFNRIEDAVAYAARQGRETGKTIIVLGGLFLASEFKVAFQGSDPQALEFF